MTPIRKIRVGFNAWILSDPNIRGLVRYTTELLRALSRRDDIEIVLFSPQKLHAPHLEGILATTVVVPALRETMWIDWLLPGKLAEWDIDLFHAPADRGIPIRKPCPLVVTVHESYERTNWRRLFPTTKSRLWYWKYELANYCRADAVLTASDTTRNKLISLGVTRERQCHRTYLAPAPAFRPDGEINDAAIVGKYGLSAPYILYVGGYDERKNVDALVRAFDAACLPEHKLAIVAEKRWGYLDLLSRWKHLDCFPKLRLLEPQQSEIPALYRGADFFANPSLWESFSFPLTEAMACGTPVLCSNRTALPEIASDAAQYFDPDSWNELVYWLHRFAVDSDLKSKLRQKGFERIKAFSWNATAEQTVAIYRQVLRNHGNRVSKHRGSRVLEAPQEARL